MPVFNGGAYLEAAIESILGQSFHDFEFVIVDDGSTDGTSELVRSLSDARIRLLITRGEGLVAALNLGLEASRGEFIARMDADDIAHPDRLSRGVSLLGENPSVGFACSNVSVINSQGVVVGAQRESWLDMAWVTEGLTLRRPMKPIIHPSVIMRRSLVQSLGGYRDFLGAEDRDLWLRMIDIADACRLEEELLSYRIHDGGVSRSGEPGPAVSSALTVVNWLVFQRTGADLYSDRPDLLSWISDSLKNRFLRDVWPQQVVFACARTDFLENRRFAAAAKIALGSVQYRTIIGRDRARRVTKTIVDDIVEIAVGTIENEVSS